MDLWQLKIFLNVINFKSFSKAAKKIHLSQPTVSSHIKDLEHHFGCRLIDRLGKEVVPTKAGLLLYTYARRLVSLSDETETALNEFHGKISGHLVIGGSTIPGEYILPKFMGTFIKEHPDVTLSLLIADTDNIINDILYGNIELGVVGAKTDNKKISQQKIVEDDMRLIVPADHKWANKHHVDCEQLIKEPFIFREQGSGTLQSIKRSLTSKGLNSDDINVIAELGSTTAVIQGIKNKIGVSILSTIAVQDELLAGTMKALTVNGLNLKRNFYLTRHKERTISPLSRAFITFARENMVKSSSHILPPA